VTMPLPSVVQMGRMDGDAELVLDSVESLQGRIAQLETENASFKRQLAGKSREIDGFLRQVERLETELANERAENDKAREWARAENDRFMAGEKINPPGGLPRPGKRLRVSGCFGGKAVDLAVEL
jgi:uncharacterized small protein (DUF1192 family)